MSNSSIWPISGDTTMGQSGPGSDGNEEVLYIPQSSSITGASPSDFLVSYPRHSFGGGSNSSAEMQSVNLTAPVDWTVFLFVCVSSRTCSLNILVSDFRKRKTLFSVYFSQLQCIKNIRSLSTDLWSYLHRRFESTVDIKKRLVHSHR